METATTLGRLGGWRARTRQSRLGTLIVLGLTAVLVMAGVYLVNGSGTPGGLTSVKLTGLSTGEPPTIGHEPQDIATATVDGKQISLKDYRGHPVWLTFGASWCAACRAEAPDIEAAYQQAKADGVVVVEVFISEDAVTVRDYAARVGLNYVKVADPNTNIASAYRVIGIPAHFFIDRAGVLQQVRTGSLSRERMTTALAEISG